MKQVLAILTFFSMSALGQSAFTGTYFTKKKDMGFESEIFQFKKDGKFSYVLSTCTGTGLGKGTYKRINGDSLMLQFTDCGDCGEAKQVEVFTDSTLTIEIDLQIKDWEDESPIIGANVYFPRVNIGTVSEKNGMAKFSANKFKETEKLLIQFIGYEPVEIEIPIEYSKLKGIIRLSNHWVYTQQDGMAFKIIHWTHSKLKLRRYPALNMTYMKTGETNTDKLVEYRMGKLYRLYKEKFAK